MPPEEDRTTATGDMHKIFREDRSSGSEIGLYMLADRQTDRRFDRDNPHPLYLGEIAFATPVYVSLY